MTHRLQTLKRQRTSVPPISPQLQKHIHHQPSVSLQLPSTRTGFSSGFGYIFQHRFFSSHQTTTIELHPLPLTWNQQAPEKSVPKSRRNLWVPVVVATIMGNVSGKLEDGPTLYLRDQSRCMHPGLLLLRVVAQGLYM